MVLYYFFLAFFWVFLFSAVVRTHSSFVAKNYPTLKKLNPSFPILIRESSNAEPMLFARYDFGVEKSVNLSKLSEAEIVQKLEALVKDSANMHKSPESNPVKFVDIL